MKIILSVVKLIRIISDYFEKRKYWHTNVQPRGRKHRIRKYINFPRTRLGDNGTWGT